MKKFILFFVLSILTIAFSGFIWNAYILQKDYFNSKSNSEGVDTVVTNEDSISKPSFYKNYTKEDYELALKDKSVLVLYFISNWCEDCLSQDNLNQEVFREIGVSGVVGQRIHILDSESTVETEELAKKFDITKEYSFVIIDKNGASYFKHTGFLSKDQLVQKIMEVTK